MFFVSQTQLVIQHNDKFVGNKHHAFMYELTVSTKEHHDVIKKYISIVSWRFKKEKQTLSVYM
jgi:hypothetical protein